MHARAFPSSPLWPAVLTCAAVALVLALALQLPLTGRSAGVVPVAVLFDFTLTIPLLWWWLAVRGRGAAPRTLAWVFVLCLITARLLVGSHTPLTARWIEAMAVVAECALLIRITVAIRAVGRMPGSDLPERAELVTANLLGEGRIAHAVASECAFLAYACCGPWQRPHEGPDRFSHQRELGRGSLVAGMLLVMLFEMGAVHAALVATHPRLAWLLTVSSLWALFWLLGDYQALRLRRSRLGNGALQLRVGLRAHADVALADIVVAREGRFPDLRRARDLLMAFPKPAEATVLLVLARPVQVRGLYGWPQRVTRIALAPDERPRFMAALAAAGVPVEPVAHA